MINNVLLVCLGSAPYRHIQLKIEYSKKNAQSYHNLKEHYFRNQSHHYHCSVIRGWYQAWIIQSIVKTLAAVGFALWFSHTHTIFIQYEPVCTVPWMNLRDSSFAQEVYMLSSNSFQHWEKYWANVLRMKRKNSSYFANDS